MLLLIKTNLTDNMTKPTTYKKNLNINQLPESIEYPNSSVSVSAAAEAMKNLITNKDAYLPKGVLHFDLDKGFKDFVKTNLETVIDGKKVPVVMLTIQKWSEFTQTWEFVDEYKNIQMPFITIVRQPNTKPGTNANLLYNIPGNKTYVYAEVPTWDGVRKGVDLYKIPHPTPIDITYEVRIFATKQSDLNSFNKTVLKEFRSLQAYTVVNGHYIPIILESENDESQISDIEQRRFYVQTFNFVLQGFILDPEDFQVVPAISRIVIS